METQKDIFSNIGSFNDFASERGLCTDDQEPLPNILILSMLNVPV